MSDAVVFQNAGRSGIDQWNFVLSPETGSQDSSGEFCRRWLPELARLPNKCALVSTIEASRVTPSPQVSAHAVARAARCPLARCGATRRHISPTHHRRPRGCSPQHGATCTFQLTSLLRVWKCGNNRMIVTLFCACCDAVRRSSRCWMRGALRCT